MIIPLSLFSSIVLFVYYVGSVSPSRTDQPRLCPTPEDLQSPFVKNKYEEQKHEGFYYEIALKDVTQPRVCKCITSNKTILSEDVLQDDFNIQCAGKVYENDLSFELNVDPNRRGYMIGKWHGFSPMEGVEFPNTIIDVGVNRKTGDYDWAIEFQCIQGKTLGYDWIQFYAINIYSKTFDDPTLLQDLEDVARKRGLGPFLDSGSNLFVVDHNDCLQDH